MANKQFKQNEAINALLEHSIIGTPVKIQFVGTYRCFDKGQVDSYKNTAKIGFIAGYRIRNIDSRPLSYIKAYYSEDKVEFKIAIVNPGQEFILTRHEVNILRVLNGSKLTNADICSNKGRKSNVNKLGYIRERVYSSDKVTSGKEIQITDSNNELLPEYTEAFYWINYDKYISNYRVKR